MVDKAVVLIGTRGKDYGAGRFGGCFLNRVKYLLSLRKKLLAVAVLGRLTLLDRSADSFGGNPECVFHKPGQLALTIRICVPEKDRHIVFDITAFLRIIGVFDHQREALDDAAHGYAGTLRIL